MLSEHLELRRQIIQDILGDSVDEYENFTKDDSNENRRQHRQRIPLWLFLLHLIQRDKTSRYIEWCSNKLLEFKIKNTISVAALWGSVKNKTDMTYEKLGRAMRYYYGKNVIEKVSGKRYSYRFILSRRTRKHLSQFIDVSQLEMASDQTNEIDDSSSESGKSNSPPTTPIASKNKQDSEKIAKQLIKIKPLKPLPQQTVAKTKIFRPDEVMVTSVHQVNHKLISKNHINLIDENKRSAFFIPNKRSKMNDGTAYVHTSVIEKCSLTHQREGILVCNSPIRNHENDIQRDSIKASLNENYSESESLYSHHITFPRSNIQRPPEPSMVKAYSSITSNSQDEFILRRTTRRELIEKQEIDVCKLKQKLNMKQRSDPFMGCTYRRNDNEKSDKYYVYDGFDEFSINTPYN